MYYVMVYVTCVCHYILLWITFLTYIYITHVYVGYSGYSDIVRQVRTNSILTGMIIIIMIIII